MPARFEADRSGLREFLRSGDYVRALQPYAAAIEARAKSAAPVESMESAERHGRVPGRFRDSIHVEHHVGPIRHTLHVVADCDEAAVIEARHNTLRRAAG